MNVLSVFATAIALLLSITPVWGQTLAEASGRYAIAPSSRVAFSVGQVGGGGISGVFTRFSGDFSIDPREVGRSSVTFSLDPGSVATGQARVDNFLRSSAVFDVNAYPVIAFRSTRVVQDVPESAVIEGMLSAHGRTRRESFRVTLLELQGRSIAFHVVGDVLRSPYGMDVGTPIYSNVVRFDMMVRGERR